VDTEQRRWLTVIEAASYLRLPWGILDRWRWGGGGPRYYKIGNHIRYTVADLDAFLASCGWDTDAA